MAFVANHPVSDPDTGEMLTSSFDVLDVTDPAKPVLLGSLSWWDVYNDIPIAMQASGQFVYLSLQLGPNLIIDVSDPAAPALLPGPVFDPVPVLSFQKVGDLMYVGSYGLSVWDISTPTAPRKIAQYLDGSDVTAVHVSGRRSNQPRCRRQRSFACLRLRVGRVGGLYLCLQKKRGQLRGLPPANGWCRSV
jgi:hypothetical protein